MLRSQGVKPRAMGYFYKAIVQAVLLWLGNMGSFGFLVETVESFHSRVARYFTGKHILMGVSYVRMSAYLRKRRGTQTIDEDTVWNFVRAIIDTTNNKLEECSKCLKSDR